MTHNTPQIKHPLHLIIDTDFGLDDVCAILYLLYCMHTSHHRPIILHHISICQGQQLDTANGVQQLYSMLKYCGVKMGTVGEQMKNQQSDQDRKNVQDNIDINNHKVSLSRGPNKEDLFENDEEDEWIHHHFREGDWYDELEKAQNQVCQQIGIPVGKTRSSMLDDETVAPIFEDMEVRIMENDAPETLLKLVHQRPNFYSLFAIGPLTNISLVLKKDPEWFNKLRHVYFMAGNFICEGNTPNEVSEWNLFADPLSARHVFDAIEQHPFLANGKVNANRHCRVLGLEVANMDVFPATLQEIVLQRSKEAKEWNSRHQKLAAPIAKHWQIVDRITETMHKVMKLHSGSCSFDVVAAMALARDDVVTDYHRLRCSVERRKPREGECVVILHEEDEDENKITDIQKTIDRSHKKHAYQRSVHFKEIGGTDFENIKGGAMVDVGVSINTGLFQKIVEHMLRCEEIPDEPGE